MNILTIDIGGNNVKMLATDQTVRRKFQSGRSLTPSKMVAGVQQLTSDWKYDVISIGYPGRVLDDHPITEPINLGLGWVGFDFAGAFGCPIKMINDADMQALGSYRGGTMLFLGLGTGLGSTLIVRGHIVSLELGHLSYKNKTIQDVLGRKGLEKYGKKKWRKAVDRAVTRFSSALLIDDVVIGGGNSKELRRLPPSCRLGNNDDAFLGGYRLWEPAANRAALGEQTPAGNGAAIRATRPSAVGAHS